MIKNFLLNILFTIIYIIFFIPMGLLLNLFGKDYLDKKIDLEEKSYFK